MTATFLSSPKFTKKHAYLTALIAMASLSAPSFADESREAEEVIVTGLKIARSLQDTPTSVAVISDVQIAEKNINSFQDSLNDTANAHATSTGGFSIRGIDGFNVSGGGNSYLASVYVDGASLPQRMIFGGGFSTWDASQIEVLRGPQSTLQGRNALAGAVIMTTQKPTYEWGGKYQLQIGDYGQREAAIAAGGGLIDNQLAVRLSAETKDIDGFNDNIVRHETSDYRQDETYRLKFLLEPEALSGFTAQLSLTHATNTYGDKGLEIAQGDNPYKNRVTRNNDKREQFVDADVGVLELSYPLNDQWSLASFTTGSNVHSGYVWDSDYQPATGIQFMADTGSTLNYKNQEKTYSQELRLTFNYDDVKGVMGAYYFDTQVDAKSEGLSNYTLSSIGLTSTVLQANYGLSPAIADIVMAQYAPFDPANTQSLSNTTQKVTSYALFTDATWSLNKSWDIFGGLRLDHESQENNASALYTILNGDKLPKPETYENTPYAGLIPLISGINGMLYGVAADASKPALPSDAEFNTLLPKLGASYHFSKDLTTSFTIQQGYRSGGVGINTAKSTIYTYDPEYTNNYELSFRSVWLDGSLIANANLFYIDWKDQQVSVQLSSNTFDSETRNAGKSNVKGFELELTYELNESLKLYGSMGQAKTEFTDFTVVIPTNNNIPVVYELSGRSFAGAPEWTGNIGATYHGDNGIFANITANYANHSTSEINPYADGLSKGDVGFDMKNDARTLVNIQIGYEWESLGVYLIGRNIFDKEYESSVSLRNPVLGEPRQVGLSIRGKF